eukprot:459824_1
MSPQIILYTSIVSIILIYSSGIFAITQFIKFIQCTISNSNHPFFQHRQSILNIFYISCFLFTLYIINPLTLILINLNIDQTIPLFINDITNNLLFLIFFTRIWVFCFDSYFIRMLNNWMWRREIQSKEAETNMIIKYRTFLSANRRTIATISYSIIISPIYIILLILSDCNIIHHIIYRIIYTLMSIILFCVTYHLIKYTISIMTDQYAIRSELLHCIKTTGLLYTLSHTLYFIFYTTQSDHTMPILIEILIVSIANFCVIYFSCYWVRNCFISDTMSSLNGTKKSRNQSFISIFSNKHRITFEDIMSHRSGIETLCQHLANEYGLESILFLIEICQYKSKIYNMYTTFTDQIAWPAHSESNIFSVPNISFAYWLPIDERMINYSPYQIALHLYDKYIEQSTDLCVNISSSNRREIYRNFKYLSQQLTGSTNNMKESQQEIVIILYKLFDNAYSEIWKLIQNDTFIRFKSTDQFQKLIHILYPTLANQTLYEIDNIPNSQPKLFIAMKSAPLIKMGNTISPSNTVTDTDEKDQKMQGLILTRAASDPIKQISNQPMLTKIQRHSYTPYTQLNIQSDFSSEIIEGIIIPSEMLHITDTFWTNCVTSLPDEKKLEIGITIYLSMFASDRSMQNFFRKHYETGQKHIEMISLKFLNMISWLIQSLWNRNDIELYSSLTTLGNVHEKLEIKMIHFNIMFKALDETLKQYFPNKYGEQEKYSLEYIFAYGAQVMMKEPLSTKYQTYYKQLEFKFNSTPPQNPLKVHKSTPVRNECLKINYSPPTNRNIRRTLSATALNKSNENETIVLKDALSLSMRLLE